MEDAFGSFDFSSDEEQSSATSAANARAARIEAARLAAATYSAKIEEPFWFLSAGNGIKSAKDKDRATLFTIHQLYLSGEASEALSLALNLLRRPGMGDDVEVLDLSLRSALRSGREGEKEVREVARCWRSKPTFPSLALSCSRVLSSSSAEDPSAEADDPREALSSILSSLSRHPSLTPYLNQLSSVLLLLELPLLNEVLHRRTLFDDRRAEVERMLETLELGEKERVVLEGVLGMRGEVEEPKEEGRVERDVRNL